MYNLGQGLLPEINAYPESERLRLPEGTIVDASIIEAAASTKYCNDDSQQTCHEQPSLRPVDGLWSFALTLFVPPFPVKETPKSGVVVVILGGSPRIARVGLGLRQGTATAPTDAECPHWAGLPVVRMMTARNCSLTDPGGPFVPPLRGSLDLNRNSFSRLWPVHSQCNNRSTAPALEGNSQKTSVRRKERNPALPPIRAIHFSNGIALHSSLGVMIRPVKHRVSARVPSKSLQCVALPQVTDAAIIIGESRRVPGASIAQHHQAGIGGRIS